LGSAEWLQPLYRLMQADLLAGGYVQMDETPMPCQDPDVPGKTVQGWLWLISRPDSDVVFAWRMSRRQQEAAGLLHGYRGLLQSDGYAAYASFAAGNDAVIHLIYSIVVSCQRRGIEPHAYLKDVLTRLPTMTNRDDLAALTPAKWQPPPAPT
jgi:hypothetical protein